ncbi:MAG TPA: zinc ribbon domain-containing protein [Gemmatimonadales bacterium]|jgi:putative FmdB family regulatory protein|nr:zinc ribbon domain-containing protein [Gemmatimonadales bacterium]
MPIYDFSCLDCGRTFDELMRSDTRVECPGCGGARVERILSLPARPASAGKPADFSRLGPPPGGGCCGGGCQGHSH